MQDLYSGGVIGLAAILKTVVGFSVGLLRDQVRAEKWQLAFLASLGAAFLYQLLFAGLLFLIGMPIAADLYFGGMIWQPAILTAIFSMPLFLLLRQKSTDQLASVVP